MHRNQSTGYFNLGILEQNCILLLMSATVTDGYLTSKQPVEMVVTFLYKQYFCTFQLVLT